MGTWHSVAMGDPKPTHSEHFLGGSHGMGMGDINHPCRDVGVPLYHLYVKGAGGES